MKYCIETTDNGCIETLEISDEKNSRENQYEQNMAAALQILTLRISWKQRDIVRRSWKKYMTYMMDAKR